LVQVTVKGGIWNLRETPNNGGVIEVLEGVQSPYNGITSSDTIHTKLWLHIYKLLKRMELHII